MNLNSETLEGRVCALIQDYDPDAEGYRTWDDALRAVLAVIKEMTASYVPLKDMNEEQKRAYYTGKQRECRQRKR